jgi:hypothetical protein
MLPVSQAGHEDGTAGDEQPDAGAGDEDRGAEGARDPAVRARSSPRR